MLEYEKVLPEKLAYDRPSPKLLGFLTKHYSLKNFIPQNNNYVVFDDYFGAKLPSNHKTKLNSLFDRKFESHRPQALTHQQNSSGRNNVYGFNSYGMGNYYLSN